LLLTWLLLKGRQIELATFGLDYTLKQADRVEPAADSQRSVQLLQALLAPDGKAAADSSAAVRGAFDASACCSFMQVHESGGTEWFNKECYEELLEWFSLIALLGVAARKPAPRTITVRLGRLAAENRQLVELAAHAGYRAKLLLRLLEPVTIVTEAALISNKVRKKADVQNNSRTRTAKTPHNKVPR
jgi:hypothetical protein